MHRSSEDRAHARVVRRVGVAFTWAVVLTSGVALGGHVVFARPALPPAGGPRVIEAVTPAEVPVARPTKVLVRGRGFRGGDRVYAGDRELPTEWVSSATIAAVFEGLSRGEVPLGVGRAGAKSAPVSLTVTPVPPVFPRLPLVVVAEEQPLVLEFVATSAEPERRPRVLAEELPPGAEWDERTRTLRFTPDLIQGGRTFTARFRAIDGVVTSTGSVDIEVDDTLRPPEPHVVTVTHKPTWTRIVLDQGTDANTSGPRWRGKSYEARICVPSTASGPPVLPVKVFLHGADAVMSDGCSSEEIRIYPADPDTTYWWGYDGANYTQRRVLQLVDWVLDTFPGADPRRVYLEGTSMGGAGVLNLGLTFARHFAAVEAYWAQSVPRRQRPGRVHQLVDIWGSPPRELDERGGNPWDLQDVTRLLVEDRGARDQFLFVRHGKDDPVIHFGAAVMPSKLTGLSLYQALELTRVGHYVVWDEAGHGTPDPVMGKHWWDSGWRWVADSTTYLRTDLAFPAFSGSSANDDPGDGPRESAAAFDASRGYAGKVGVPGDTGWNGAVAGALNRWLRWDSAAIVDEVDRLELPLFARADLVQMSLGHYPTKGDARASEEPIVVSVTPRRVQRFRCLPGERVSWRFGQRSGEVTADAEGAVTVRELPITVTPELLVLERVPSEMGM